MKICMASYPAVSILHGGPNTQLRMTARHLAQYGIDPVLFDPWARFGKESAGLVHLFAANIGTYHLAREVRDIGIPLVVSPIIFSRHSSNFIRAGLWGTRLLQGVWKGVWTDYALTADICAWASALLPNTRAEADLLVKGLGVKSNMVHVIPNGVEERFLVADPGLFKKTYGLQNFILNVGHIGHERKNVLALIKALGEIDHPSVIIGRRISGGYGDACVREAQKHKQILLLEGLDHESEMLASAYAACDVFALPSLFETPGIAALEAGLAGAKIVITQTGGTKEYFEGMAVYVDPLSVDSIKQGILAALQNPKTTGLREHINKSFLWSRVAEKTAQVYRKVMNTHSA